ncbi:MAG: class II glutamine amidotransferase [Alphaproteobacteria bacterium]|nr:class II glutamine amidotransferase [Alphaproteobacteria bacterium]
MCRFVLYQGPEIPIADLVTRPSHSIIHQSFKAREREEPLNGDGFGLAWYTPALSAEPALFRSITPAWNNQNLLHLARVTTSRTILAHVRAATSGLSVMETNCHPFVSGRYAFMHNGFIEDFHAVRRRLLATLSDRAFGVIGGTTDSEHAFALWLDQLDGEGADAMADAMARTVARIAELAADTHGPSLLNLAVTDGVNAVVSRSTTGSPEGANSLYVLSGRRYICNPDGEGHTEEAHPIECSVLVASEPLFPDPAWHRVPPNQMVVLRGTGDVELRDCTP